jgi:hypothetical protein
MIPFLLSAGLLITVPFLFYLSLFFLNQAVSRMSLYASETYYLTLGLAPGASDHEIKQAYRRRAKLLHPDRNPSPTAHQQFIQLTEAYEYLITHRDDTARTTYTQQTYEPTYQQPPAASRWESSAREQARRRAAEHASMSYDEFTDSEFYQSLQSVETVFRYLFILVLILIVVGIVTFLIASSGLMGVFFSALFLIMPVALIYSRLKEEQLDLTDLHESGIYLIRQKWFLSIAFTILNFYTIYRFGMQTLLGSWSLAGIYMIPMGCCGVSLDRLRPQMSVFQRGFYAFCVTPMVVSLFFAVNFIFAQHPVEETYRYSTLGRSAHEIILPHYRYDDYPFLTMFADEALIRSYNSITYTFADGLLGLRVMKEYRLEIK